MIKSKIDALIFALLFITLGTIVMLNRPAQNTGWFFLVGAFFVFAGLFGLVATFYPIRRKP